MIFSPRRQLKRSIRRPSTWAVAGPLGYCWAVQCRSAREGATLGVGRLAGRSQKGEFRAATPLLFPLIRPIPQSRRPPHNPSRLVQGLSHLVLCMGRQLPPPCWKAGQTTDDAIRHRHYSESQQLDSGNLAVLAAISQEHPRLSRHLALSLICDLLIWPSRCLAFFLGHAFARRRSLGFSLVFLASNSQSSRCAPCAPLFL